MTTYSAPTRDMIFVINELAGLGNINQFPGLEDATVDLVGAILDEASRMASEVLDPINQTGDQTGAKIIDGEVHTVDGFGDAYQAFVEAGWPALPFDQDRGGQGLPEMVSSAVNEVWQSANMAWSLCPMLTEGAAVALETHGSEELKNKYLPKMISGQWTGTMNLTESQAGSDLAAVKTKAEPKGDHYLITGQKIFITWGDHDLSENIIHMVLARIPDAPPGIKGISLFLVPKYSLTPEGTIDRRNDVYPVSIEHKLGIHASPTCVMSFGDNGGAVGYLLGEKHNGIACMFTMMNHARVAVGIQGLSISERAYQHALNYARERIQGKVIGKADRTPIIHHPDVRRMLMIMKSGTEAMRALCYITAVLVDHINHNPDSSEQDKHSQLFTLLTPVVKGWCTELAQELTSLGIQIHGGMGYIEETGAAQYVRDARITTIYEGTSGIQALDLVGRKIIRDNGKAMRELLAMMAITSNTLSQSDDKTLKIIGDYLSPAIGNLEQATSWLLDNYQSDANAPGSVAFNLLMLMGTVCGGWQMGRAALIAHEKINSNESNNADFYKTKLNTARFYAEHFLPRTSVYLQTILAGSETIMALESEQF